MKTEIAFNGDGHLKAILSLAREQHSCQEHVERGYLQLSG